MAKPKPVVAITAAAGGSTDDGPQCQALNISDGQRCRDVATDNNDMFCKLHNLQCFSMYRGYKRRNAELDALLEKEPAFLRNSKIALINQNFEGVTEESELQEIHQFLFDQSVLLRKVIQARDTHHRHFYSQDMDYGHKAYLDRLIGRQKAVAKALDSLERRSAVVIFRKEKWYDWVRKEQEEEEEANREMEQKKKIKQEAALFRRHWGGVQARLKAAREKEEKKRQEAYLEQVWRERMAAGSEDSDVDWDPIEDVYQNDRERFTDLIRHFLWMERSIPEVTEPDSQTQQDVAPEAEGGEDAAATAEESIAGPKKKKARGKRKGKPQTAAPVKESQGTAKNTSTSQGKQAELDKNNIESKEEVKKRLREGMEKEYDHVQGPMVVGTAQMPHELYKRTATYSEEDAERLVSEIAEIKLLLFCRQLLSRPQLLPAALRANSVEEFLADGSVPESELRDLCLKVEQPSLQSLRDACADFARGDEPDDDEEEEDVLPLKPPAEYLAHHMRYGSLEDAGRRGTSLLRDLTALETRKMFDVDSLSVGELKRGPKDKKVKIKVCGRSIWNYASQSGMARDGWLHFCIMAKDCSFPDAMSLCRNWDEFEQLHFLAGWQFFPAAKWSAWSGNMLIEDLISKGFVPFYVQATAEEETTYNKMPKLTQKALASHRLIVEARNVICAYMKRNDAASRRFIQYILLNRGEAMILVRDGKTGRIVVAANDNERWWRRAIPGYMAPNPGHSTSDQLPWDREEIDKGFFATAQANRRWSLGFDAYYEVYIWDNAPGGEIGSLIRLISDSLWKAHKVRGLRDKYKIQKHVIQGLTRDKDTKAVRPLRPGEQAQTLYEELTHPQAMYWVRTKYGKMVQTQNDLPTDDDPYLFYNDADAAEDAILFDDSLPADFPFIEISNPLHVFETGGMPPSLLNYRANLLRKKLLPLLPKKKTSAADVEGAVSDDSDSEWESDDSVTDLKPYAPGAEEFNYYIAPLWAQAHRKIGATKLSKERQDLLRKLDFHSVRLEIPSSKLSRMLSPLEVMERDRSYVFKDTFHLSDLEEGARERYDISNRLLRGIQNFSPANPSTDWAWFCMQTLDWMNLKLHFKDYTTEPFKPWPHRYMAQDITQAFVAMALFFPDLPVASVVRTYLDTKEGSEFKASPLFDLAARAKYRPDCRTRTSNRFRQPSFWTQLEELKKSKRAIFEIYPMDWSILIRTTIAKRNTSMPLLCPQSN